jgi:hypothetical protein
MGTTRAICTHQNQLVHRQFSFFAPTCRKASPRLRLPVLELLRVPQKTTPQLAPAPLPYTVSVKSVILAL